MCSGGDVSLNPIVGLDIAKEESKGQVFLERGLPYGGSFNDISSLQLSSQACLTRHGLVSYYKPDTNRCPFAV